MSSINYTQHTKDQSTTHVITWNIPDFLRLVNNSSNNELRPDKSLFADNENSKEPRNFELKILFCGQDNDLIEFYFLSRTSVQLWSKLTVMKRVEIDPVIDPLNHDYLSKFIIQSDTKYKIVNANTWQYITKLYNYDSVNKEKNVSQARSYDGKLNLCFEFTIDTSLKLIGPIFEEENQFINNFEELFISGLYSDIVMKSADDVEYKVHKAVLASRSAVLKAHFEHNTIECHTNVVSSPLDSDVLKEVLTFIYSDKAPRVDEMPEKLLAAGDYYQLGKLKNLASKALYEKLTVDNAIETLQLADLHSVLNLKESTLDYIKSLYASSVTGTEGWAKLNSVELTKTLYEYITRY